jgi:hypothetical protein
MSRDNTYGTVLTSDCPEPILGGGSKHHGMGSAEHKSYQSQHQLGSNALEVQVDYTYVFNRRVHMRQWETYKEF